MMKLSYDELLDYYGILIDLVMSLKAEKEAYIDASKDVYEHPISMPKNFDSTSFSSQYDNSRLEKAQKLLDAQRYIEFVIEMVGNNIREMTEVKRQLDFLLEHKMR